jgi:hypothetical protein
MTEPKCAECDRPATIWVDQQPYCSEHAKRKFKLPNRHTIAEGWRP